MMKLSLMLLFLPVLASCQEAKPEAKRTPEEELKLLTGEWKLVSSEKDGKKFINSEQSLAIDGKNCANTTVGKVNVVMKSTIAVDPTQKPKRIEVTQEDGRTVPGLYDLTDNRLLFLYYDKNKGVPSGFDTKGTDNLLFTYERVKPKQ